MPKRSETLYDLTNSTDLQLKRIESVDLSSPSVDDWAKPEMVAVLLERHHLTLTDLKQLKGANAELETRFATANDQITELRINLARAQERQNIFWLEIPLGALLGFAINMLTQDDPPLLGWFLLAISIVMLLFIRAYPLLFSKSSTDISTVNQDAN
jgi:hypothetical protein